LGDLVVAGFIILKWILKCRMRFCENDLFGAMAAYVGHGMNSGA
jgi:hypothetical protein